MPKVNQVFDEKPVVGAVFDEIPKNKLVFDEKPNTSNMQGELIRSYNIVINRAMPIGLLLTLTYPENVGTVIQWSERGMVTP